MSQPSSLLTLSIAHSHVSHHHMHSASCWEVPIRGIAHEGKCPLGALPVKATAHQGFALTCRLEDADTMFGLAPSH